MVSKQREETGKQGDKSPTYKVFDCRFVGPQNDGGRVIRLFALGLRVDTLKVELLPHGLHELVDIPTVLGADWDRVGDSVEQIQLLDADGINLVEAVDDRNITA